MKPNILVFDIETSYIIGGAWRTRDTDLATIIQDWYMLSFAYQWHGKKQVHVKALCDYKGNNDKALVTDLWGLFDKADIVVGFNSDRFDIRKANDRFLHWGMDSPSFYRTVDLMKVYKKHFNSTSNKLDYICQKHSIGKKLEHQGIDLWTGCMNNDEQAWRTMKKYNAHDVRLTTGLYDFLLPWMDRHPNMNDYFAGEVCPNCGGEEKVSHGIRTLNGTDYRRLQCRDCGTHYKQTLSKSGKRGRITGK